MKKFGRFDFWLKIEFLCHSISSLFPNSKKVPIFSNHIWIYFLKFSTSFRSCSWQLPRPEADIPRMGSDVGATRIWNRLLDAAFDNSDRRKHGMGYLGRMMTGRRRAKRRAPESTRKRKLGGNSVDHRPFFTYWMTTVQIFVMLITIAVYGIGPIGIDLYKKSGMVSFLTWLFWQHFRYC